MSDAHESEEIWFVQLPDGGVRAYSLEQLDEAFQAGTIDENTLVRSDDSTTWAPLAEVLAGAEEPAPSAPEPPAMATQTFVAAAPAIGMVHPTPMAIEALPPSAPPPPVEIELFSVDEIQSAGGKKRVIAFGAIGVIAALGAAAFFTIRAGDSLPDASKVGASLPVAAAAGKPADDPSAADAGPRFNEDQRRQLLELDKRREAEAEKRRANRPVRSNSGPSKPIKMGDPIKKGGSQYDPLNGSL